MASPVLGQFTSFDKKKMREIARKAGEASVEARRKKKEIRTVLQTILDGSYTVLDATGEEVKLSGNEIFALRAFENSITPGKDQVKWWEYVRDTVGQKPTDKIELSDTRVVVDIDDSDDEGTINDKYKE